MGAPKEMPKEAASVTASATAKVEAVKERLEAQVRELHLPTVRSSYAELVRHAEVETLGYERYLLKLCARECPERRRNPSSSPAILFREIKFAVFAPVAMC